MAGDEEELEALRRRKLEQIQQEQAGVAAEEQKRQELEEAKKNIIRQILTSEARERLNTIRMQSPNWPSNWRISLSDWRRRGD